MVILTSTSRNINQTASVGAAWTKRSSQLITPSSLHLLNKHYNDR